MARKPKNANIDIRQTTRVFNEQALVNGVFNDDDILVVGCGVVLDRKQFPDSIFSHRCYKRVKNLNEANGVKYEVLFRGNGALDKATAL